jgi:hypothetical protein
MRMRAGLAQCEIWNSSDLGQYGKDPDFVTTITRKSVERGM